jgi:hypothetical protein
MASKVTAAATAVCPPHSERGADGRCLCGEEYVDQGD